MANRFAEKFQAGLQMGTTMLDAWEKNQLKRDLAAAGKLTPEQQSVGVNAPAQGAVPTGYEDHLAVDTQTGNYVPTADPNVNPELHAQQGVMAERFNAPNAFQGERTSYSLGNVSRDKAFTPDEVTAARRQAMADVYTKYGDVDRADAMMERADQAQMRKLQIDDLKKKAAIADKQAAIRGQHEELQSALSAAIPKIDAQLEAGEMTTDQAAKLLQSVYNEKVPNGYNLEIADGKMWHTDPKDPNKKIGTDITKQNVMEAFRDLPSMVDRHYEIMYNAAGGDFKAIGEARRADEQLGLQRRGVTNQEKLTEHTIAHSDIEDYFKGTALAQDAYKITELIRHNKAEESLKGTELKNNAAYKELMAKVLQNKTSQFLGMSKDNQAIYMTQDGLTAKPLPAGVTREDIFSKVTGDKGSPIPPAEAWKSAEAAVDADPKAKNVSAAKRAELVRSAYETIVNGSPNAERSVVNAAEAVYGNKKDNTSGLQNQQSVAVPSVNTSNWSLGQGTLARNPAAVKASINKAIANGEPIDPQMIEVAKFLNERNPGFLDAGMSGNRNTAWLLNQ